LARRPAPKKANPALRLAAVRQLHVYLSVFVAPTLIFFCLTGMLQTFRIPDRTDAPAVMVKLAHLHRDTEFVQPPPKKAPPPKPGAPKPEPKRTAPAKFGLQTFFALASLAVVATTLLGLWMALVYNRRKGLLVGVLLLGCVLPATLVLAALKGL
jgi:hypothetical protein